MTSLGRHTVDTPVGLAVIIADSNAEPSIVGSDDLDVLLGVAGNHQGLPLARVSGPDGR